MLLRYLNSIRFNISLSYCHMLKALQTYSQTHKLFTVLENICQDLFKGYYRKGEVLLAAYQLSEALLSYRIALQLLPNDLVITEAVKRTTLLLYKDKRADQQIPWVGAGVGIILGVIIVICDQVLPAKPSMTHPLLMALVAISVALLGLAGAKSFRYYTMCTRKGLMDPPLDLLEAMKKDKGTANGGQTEEKLQEKTQRHTKAQSRLKLRKSKV